MARPATGPTAQTGSGRGGEPAKLIDAKPTNMVDAGQSFAGVWKQDGQIRFIGRAGCDCASETTEEYLDRLTHIALVDI